MVGVRDEWVASGFRGRGLHREKMASTSCQVELGENIHQTMPIESRTAAESGGGGCTQHALRLCLVWGLPSLQLHWPQTLGSLLKQHGSFHPVLSASSHYTLFFFFGLLSVFFFN